MNTNNNRERQQNLSQRNWKRSSLHHCRDRKRVESVGVFFSCRSPALPEMTTSVSKNASAFGKI